jgi:galactokinase
MMDHFTCALGGVIRLDCRPPYRAEALPSWPGEFVLVDSVIPKDTNDMLGACRRALEALPLDYAALADFADAATPEGLRLRDPVTRTLAEVTIGNRRLTEPARQFLLSSPDQAALGRLLTDHHRRLSAERDVSLPETDAHLAAGMVAGAAGGKINGSGCGGSFFVLCPGRGQQMQQLYQSCSLRADIVRIGYGVEVQQ